MLLRSLTTGVLLAVVVSSTAGATANPEANKASYWGNNCTKTEMSGETMTFTAPANATKVIVKGGTDNKVYTTAPFSNLTAPLNEKNGKTYAISHVIVCTDAVKATVTPAGGGSITPDKKDTPAPVKQDTKAPEAAKGGGSAVTPASTLQTPTVLPEVGASANMMFIAVCAAMAAGTLAHRRLVSSRVV